MPQYGTYSSLGALKDWFERTAEDETPKWILYHGHVMRAGPGSKNAQQKENLTIEESWQVLENFLTPQIQGGGNFTVYIISEKGNPGPRAFLAIPGGNANGAGVAGVGNVNSYIEEKIEGFKTQFMLQQEIEALREEMRAKRNVGERMLEQLMDSGVVAQLIAGFAAKQLGVSGIGENYAGMQGQGGDDLPEPGENQYNQDQIQRLEGAIAKLARHFPRLDVTLSNVAKFVERNPEQAKMILNQLGNDSEAE